jgi:hypothetical protein
VAGFCVCSNEPSGLTKVDKFPDYQNNYSLFNKILLRVVVALVHSVCRSILAEWCVYIPLQSLFRRPF